MSERDFEENRSRGSSRSGVKGRDDRFYKEFDDSRDKEKRSEKRIRRDRSRSRSPDRSHRRSRSREDKHYPRSKRESDTNVREMSISPQREEGHGSKDSSPPPPPPPAPRISKISIGFKSTAKNQPIKMSLNTAPTQSNVPKKPPLVASVFNDGSDDEPEEMPAEARMRMRNIGRDTPTSAGPNSFGKTKHGFCDEKAIFQKNLKEAMDKVNPNSQNFSKFCTTVYKLSK